MEKVLRSPINREILKKYNDKLVWGGSHVESVAYAAELRDGVLATSLGVGLRPVSLRWEGGEIPFRPERQTREKNNVRYADAYGVGVHLDYEFGLRNIRKYVVFDKIPEGKGDIEAVFEIECPGELIPGWDGAEVVIDGPIKGDGWGIEAPVATSRDETIPIGLRLWRSEGKTYVAKVLPRSWMEEQGLPIRADLNITLDGGEQLSRGDAGDVYDNNNSVAALSSTKFVVVYSTSESYGGDSGIYAKVGTVSGTSISLGDSYEILADTQPGNTVCVEVAALDASHFVVFYSLGGTYVRAGSVSGTTISLGASVTLGSGASLGDIAALDSTHFVAVWRYNGSVRAGSVSGTTITLGATVYILSSHEDIYYPSIAALDSSHFVIAYGYDYSGYVVTGSVSGTTVTLTQDSGTKFESGNVHGTATAALDSSHFVIAFSDSGDSDKGKVIAGSVSGTTISITLDGAVTFESGRLNDNTCVAALDSSRFVIAFCDYDDNRKSKVIAGSVSGTTISITCDGATTFESGGSRPHGIAALSPYVFVISFDDDDDGDKPKVIAGATNYPPSAPTSLLCEGVSNPQAVTDLTPEFSAVYNDPDSGDTATDCRIQVASDSGFANIVWDSGKIAISNTAEGSRCPNVSYAGPTLSLNGQKYYWRIKFWDNAGAEGDWSTE